jgi:hypothetical protein
MLLFENQTPNSVEIKDLGITIPPNATYDLQGKSRDAVTRSNGLINALLDNSCKLVKSNDFDNIRYFDTADAIRKLTGADAGLKLSESGELEVNMGSKVSEVGSKKLWVHESPKPEIEGKQFYAYYTGSGDNVNNGTIGDGPRLIFNMQPGTLIETIKVEFVNTMEFGDTYIHEAYAMWKDAGLGDCLCVSVWASPTQLQTIANKDLVLVPFNGGNFVTYSQGGPGTGTHGFAANPVLIKAVHKDGYWDYSSANGLVPNFAKTGGFNIMDVPYKANEFINQVPLLGTTNGFNKIDSSDTAWIAPGYYLEVDLHNHSDTAWQAVLFMTMFRERTVQPISFN